MKKAVLRVALLLLPLVVSSCPPTQVKQVNERQLGEDCDDVYGCISGLFCNEGKCRQICTNNSDCPDRTYICSDGSCVKRASAINPKEGEYCDSQYICAGNLICVDSICKKPCKNKSDCRADEVCENSRCRPEILPERGEPCSNAGKCAAGLTCLEKVCQKTCNLDVECGDEQLICQKKICSPKPDKPVGPSGREEVTPIAGGFLTPVYGVVENERFKVRVLGGALQGVVQNEQNSARLADGAWEAKSEE